MYKIIGADGKEYGPVTGLQISQWIAEGRANASTTAQAEGATEWKPLAEFPEFAAALAVKTALPPQAVPAPVSSGPENPDLIAQEIIARGVDFSIGDCIGRGWALVLSDFWPIVGVCALMLLILMFANGISIGILINGALLGGLYYYFLKRIRGQPADLNDAFAGFSAFVPLLLASLISGLLTGVGLMLCILPGIYLAVAWYFTFFLVIDKKLDFWPAMEVSRQVVNKVWWSVLGLLIVNGLICLLGFMMLCVGIFVTFPITLAATAYAYETIFNPPTRPAA
jgi:hypothetical protein